MAGAHWGTLMHEAMQYLPLADYDQASLQEALDSLVDREFLRLDEATQLDQRALLAFFQSPLADRMRQSDRVERELPFSMLYLGQSVYPNLAKVTGIPVKEAYIYSFRLGKAIPVEI